MYGLTQTSPPSEEPLRLSDLKERLDITSDDQTRDGELSRLIVAARQIVEAQTHRQLVTASWRLTRSGFGYGAMYIPLGRLQSVESVKYYDTANTLQTLDPSAYLFTLDIEPAELEPIGNWPSTYARQDAVQVEFTCGYGAREDVPVGLTEAIALHCKVLWEPEAVGSDPFGAAGRSAAALIEQYHLGDEWARYA